MLPAQGILVQPQAVFQAPQGFSKSHIEFAPSLPTVQAPLRRQQARYALGHDSGTDTTKNICSIFDAGSEAFRALRTNLAHTSAKLAPDEVAKRDAVCVADSGGYFLNVITGGSQQMHCALDT
jgi:hypothetical protein